MTVPLEKQLAEDAKAYANLGDDEIMRVIETRARLARQRPEEAADIEMATPEAVLERAETIDETAEGIIDDLFAGAGRLVANVEDIAFNMACGDDPEFTPIRRRLAEMISEGASVEDVAGALALAFVSWMGISNAIAAGVAVIIARRFLKGSIDQFCDRWASRRFGSAPA